MEDVAGILECKQLNIGKLHSNPPQRIQILTLNFEVGCFNSRDMPPSNHGTSERPPHDHQIMIHHQNSEKGVQRELSHTARVAALTCSGIQLTNDITKGSSHGLSTNLAGEDFFFFRCCTRHYIRRTR
jgi:hypothetical protein